jgi:integrase
MALYAKLRGEPNGPLFRTTGRKTGQAQALWQQDVYRMIQRRAAAAGITTKIGNHTFRATRITAYLKNKGTLEHAQTIANHASPRTTKLYDRRSDEIALDEVEKMLFGSWRFTQSCASGPTTTPFTLSDGDIAGVTGCCDSTGKFPLART